MPDPSSPPNAALRAWLADFRRDLPPLEKAYQEAFWQASIAANKENQHALGAAHEALERFLADPERYESLGATPAAVTDPLLERERELARLELARHQMDEDLIAKIVPLETEVEGEYARFRAKLGEERVSDNRLRDILRRSKDSTAVEAGWRASKQIGPLVADRVRELARLRNDLAHRNGYPDYQRMALALSEIDPAALFALLEDIDQVTQEPFREAKDEIDAELSRRFGISRSDLRPWHYGDPFFQSAPASSRVDLDRFYAKKDLAELTREFFHGLGLDITDILARSDLLERDGKNQHAFCTHIDRSGDVRVLSNNRPSEEWMGTMLHEFGHAVYDKYLDPDLPYLLRTPSHTLVTEAIAMLCGRLPGDEEFLIRIAEAEPAQARAAASAAAEQLRRNELIFIRWALVVVGFERELYADPTQDLQAVWEDLVGRYQLLAWPDDRSQAADWAAKIHVATVPVYYQNYILGDLAASQISHYLRAKVLGGAPSIVGRPEAGEWLVAKIFRPGSRWPWNDHLREAVGENLDARYFCMEFAEP